MHWNFIITPIIIILSSIKIIGLPAYLEIPLVLASVIMEGAEGNSVALAVPGVLELLVDEDSTEDPYEYFVMLEEERHRGEKWRN